jgi:hypothetical protein
MTADEAAAAADAAVMNRTVAGAATPQSGTGVVSNNAAGLPLPGLITLGVVVVGGLAVLLFVALRRLAPAVASGIDAADSVGDGSSFGFGIGEDIDAAGSADAAFKPDFSEGPAEVEVVEPAAPANPDTAPVDPDVAPAAAETAAKSPATAAEAPAKAAAATAEAAKAATAPASPASDDLSTQA